MAASRVWETWLLLVFLWLTPLATCYFVHIDAHAEECFFDRASSGMKLSLTFEVVEGGFLDIDLHVRSSTHVVAM